MQRSLFETHMPRSSKRKRGYPSSGSLLRPGRMPAVLTHTRLGHVFWLRPLPRGLGEPLDRRSGGFCRRSSWGLGGPGISRTCIACTRACGSLDGPARSAPNQTNTDRSCAAGSWVLCCIRPEIESSRMVTHGPRRKFGGQY